MGYSKHVMKTYWFLYLSDQIQCSLIVCGYFCEVVKNGIWRIIGRIGSATSYIIQFAASLRRPQTNELTDYFMTIWFRYTIYTIQLTRNKCDTTITYVRMHFMIANLYQISFSCEIVAVIYYLCSWGGPCRIK